MKEKEIAIPVRPEEADDIRVTLELDNGEVECEILTIFEAGGRDYMALMMNFWMKIFMKKWMMKKRNKKMYACFMQAYCIP